MAVYFCNATYSFLTNEGVAADSAYLDVSDARSALVGKVNVAGRKFFENFPIVLHLLEIYVPVIRYAEVLLNYAANWLTMGFDLGRQSAKSSAQ
ncbi:MAG: hypothetical protein IPN97_08110 [Saprospiraceae bacterium]|nr:hypothetical protein [Saprospiraceae bacterium]